MKTKEDLELVQAWINFYQQELDKLSKLEDGENLKAFNENLKAFVEGLSQREAILVEIILEQKQVLGEDSHSYQVLLEIKSLYSALNEQVKNLNEETIKEIDFNNLKKFNKKENQHYQILVQPQQEPPQKENYQEKDSEQNLDNDELNINKNKIRNRLLEYIKKFDSEFDPEKPTLYDKDDKRFNTGFTFFKNAQAESRRHNVNLAVSLLIKIDSSHPNQSLGEIFQNKENIINLRGGTRGSSFKDTVRGTMRDILKDVEKIEKDRTKYDLKLR